MPTYEYKCVKCEKTQEHNRGVDNRDDEAICECGEAMKRSYNAVPIKFNAPGFYSTGG